MAAIRKNYIEIVHLLLLQPDIFIPRDAIPIAKVKGHQKIVELLSHSNQN